MLCRAQIQVASCFAQLSLQRQANLDSILVGLRAPYLSSKNCHMIYIINGHPQPPQFLQSLMKRPHEDGDDPSTRPRGHDHGHEGPAVCASESAESERATTDNELELDHEGDNELDSETLEAVQAFLLPDPEQSSKEGALSGQGNDMDMAPNRHHESHESEANKEELDEQPAPEPPAQSAEEPAPEEPLVHSHVSPPSSSSSTADTNSDSSPSQVRGPCPCCIAIGRCGFCDRSIRRLRGTHED